jgi:hypothetical protein
VIRQASPTMLGGKAFERVQAVPSQALAAGVPARGESAITEFRRWAGQSYERASSEEPTLASQ